MGAHDPSRSRPSIRGGSTGDDPHNALETAAEAGAPRLATSRPGCSRHGDGQLNTQPLCLRPPPLTFPATFWLSRPTWAAHDDCGGSPRLTDSASSWTRHYVRESWWPRGVDVPVARAPTARYYTLNIPRRSLPRSASPACAQLVRAHGVLDTRCRLSVVHSTRALSTTSAVQLVSGRSFVAVEDQRRRRGKVRPEPQAHHVASCCSTGTWAEAGFCLPGWCRLMAPVSRFHANASSTVALGVVGRTPRRTAVLVNCLRMFDAGNQ